MRRTNLQRIVALLLCLMFVFGCFAAVPAGAAAVSSSGSSYGSSTTGQTLADIKELLNAISYEEYLSKYSMGDATESVVIDAVEALNREESDGDYKVIDGTSSAEELAKYGGKPCVYTAGYGERVSWNISVPKTGLYTIKIEYYASEGKAASIERVLMIDGKVPFAEARYLTLPKNWVNDYHDAKYTGKASISEVKSAADAAGIKYREENGTVYFIYPDVWTQAKSNFCDKYSIRFMKVDIYENELRPEAVQSPYWTTYSVKDSTGYECDAFKFAFHEGEILFTLEGKNEPMAISSITLCPAEVVPTYEEYMKQYASAPAGKDIIKLEGEYTSSMTDKTIFAVEDRSSAANSPCASDKTLLNTMGAEKWQTVGQAVSYTFSVESSGMYDIITRFRQNVLDGIFVSRALYVYSEGLEEGELGYYNGLPFAEAAQMVFNYGDDWQVSALKNQDSDTEFKLYFAEGVKYTVKLEVTLGALGELISDVQDALNSINDDYLTILRLTGTNPDSNRDYRFTTVMPDQMIDMVIQSRVLNYDDEDYPGVAQKLTEYAGQKSSHVGTLQKVADLLLEMGTDEDQVARNLERLKSYIGTLGTFLSDIKSQPLQIDYLMVQPEDAEEPVAKAGFFKTLWHEIKSFFWSFFREYDGMGVMDEESIGTGTEVWLATGRDQSQVIRTLINNDFTPQTQIAVDLKLVAPTTLLPSILARKGPDVYLGLVQTEVINYAIRSAVLPVDGMAGFDEHIKSFNEAAMKVLEIENADGDTHVYGLPEQQGFTMMFIRNDVLADLGLEVPKTWDDIMAAVPVLQSKNMEIGLVNNYQIFLYQMGGELFADDGMRINLDSKVGLDSFERTCNFFTQYGFPYIFDAANRFRTGEMPIVISDYTALYNQLKVFATEIEGLWQFVPMPGEIQADGTVNNCSVSSVNATVMVSGCKDEEKAWEFMKWYTGKQCQVDYSNEMVAIMGPSAKNNTANREALSELPWTREEYESISAQFENLASIPNYPGTYIIARYTNFAFLSAYNENADPVAELLAYVPTINKEITRKREEFGLETLEVGQTLKEKRTDQAKLAIEELISRGLSSVVDDADKALRLGEDATIKEVALSIGATVGKDEEYYKKYKLRNNDIENMSDDELKVYLGKALYDVSQYQ